MTRCLYPARCGCFLTWPGTGTGPRAWQVLHKHLLVFLLVTSSEQREKVELNDQGLLCEGSANQSGGGGLWTGKGSDSWERVGHADSQAQPRPSE